MEDEFDYNDIEDISDAVIHTSKDASGYPGIMPQFDDGYKPINIDATQIELQNKAQSLVDDVIKVYYKIDDNDSDIVNYLKGYSQVETMTVQNLLLQVKASEHVLLSLIARLNATGSVDNGLYKLINETQEKCLSLTLQVSSYIRSLPTYFKQLRFELETNVEMIHVSETQELMDQRADGSSDDDFVKKPQKGMRSFLKEIEALEKTMEDEGEDIVLSSELPSKDDNPIDDEAERLRQQLIDENS